MKSVVCERFIFVVILASPDPNVERDLILGSDLVRLPFKLAPLLAPLVKMKPRAFGVASKQSDKSRPISFLMQWHLDGRDGSDALLIGGGAA